LLEAVYTAAGYRVGCYTSPHLIDYNERVRVNSAPVSDAALCEAFARVERTRQTLGDVALTYFEFGTLAAWEVFAAASVEVAILEVGLGGRLDAVNVYDPDCAVVTGVALDHTDWLGDTREAIGFEKAGIFRSNRPAICADPEPPPAPRLNGWMLTLAGFALAGTLAMPFLKIHDWLLADRAYSILSLSGTLLSTGAWTAGTVAAFFLVIAPLSTWALELKLWRQQRRSEATGRTWHRLLSWRRWSMLDVFGLALAVFLVEGDQLMHTEVRWGALFLVALVALRWALDVLLLRGERR
jgi:uncharacterized membrane protein YciS (DUF1049 family)